MWARSTFSRPEILNFWGTKIAGNRERDVDTDRRLVEAGWTSVRVWEHEDPAAAALRVADAVRASPAIIPANDVEPKE